MSNHVRVPTALTHATLSVIILVLLVVLTVAVVSPFLTSLMWATIVSVAVWPFLLRLQALAGGRRGLAVAIMTSTILLVVFVPAAPRMERFFERFSAVARGESAADAFATLAGEAGMRVVGPPLAQSDPVS